MKNDDCKMVLTCLYKDPLFRLGIILNYGFIFSSQMRSHSVASIALKDLESISSIKRTKKPWNEWRRVSMVTRSERDSVIREIQRRAGEKKKSFEDWFVEKEVTRGELTTKIYEEERMKRLEREQRDEERKAR